jgi:antitoxin VapB
MRRQRWTGWRMCGRGGLGEVESLHNPRISRISCGMNKPVHTRAFKSGNSVAVRLPKGFAIPAGAELELDKSGDTVTIRITRDRDEVRRQLQKLTADLEAIGAPPDGVQQRDPFDFPDRPGLL